MRFVFGKGWTFEEEADDGAQGGAGGGASGGDGGQTGDDADGDTGATDAGAKDAGATTGEQGGAKKEEAPKDMKSAIDAALGYKKGPNGEALDPLTGKPKAAQEDAGEKKGAKAPLADGKETETHYANGKPKKNEKGEPLDDKGQVVKASAPKVKTSAELALKPEELKALGAKTGQRFTEMIGALKAHEGTIATLTGENKVLKEGRDAILGVMKETHTTQDQLGGYLEFNRLLHSNDPKDLEEALQMVESQRAALYTALGREPEGGGIDLLKDFPDLAKQVDDSEITRAAALEIAKGRRERAAREQTQQRQQQQQQQKNQSAEQQKKAADKALADIEAWTAELGKSDLDYKAKEDRLLAKVDEVLKKYPPAQWLQTLQLMYEGIEITKAAPAAGDKAKQPLRPSNVRPGGKAPANMLDAINQGLGYAGAEKG